jgi:hypothetical protein
MTSPNQPNRASPSVTAPHDPDWERAVPHDDPEERERRARHEQADRERPDAVEEQPDGSDKPLGLENPEDYEPPGVPFPGLAERGAADSPTSDAEMQPPG